MSLPIKLFCICLLLISQWATAQRPLNIGLNLKYGVHDLTLNTPLEPGTDSNNLTISALKFYISNVKLLHKNQVVFTALNGFFLTDASLGNKQNIPLSIPSTCEFDAIQFDLGIDSLTNVAGVLGGNLDPTLGMYWTWQSGYINFKLEGTATVCPTRNNAFNFHLGGYQTPYNAIQTIKLTATSSQFISIQFDVEKFLHQIDLSLTNQVMSPSLVAVKLATMAAQAFTSTLP